MSKVSWMLVVLLVFIVVPLRGQHGTSKISRRIRRSGPNVCGRGVNAQCCVGWQPSGLDQSLCIKPVCNFDCGAGVCVRPNVCLCQDGQYNPTCRNTNCKVRCLNGGTCKDDKCECPQGYMGQFCENPVCEKPCLNGGTCRAPNTCACLYGFAGPACEADFRQGPCYKEIKDLTCRGQVSTLICTKELCCATIGKAWGIPCEQCPSKPEPCQKGFLPDYESRECLDIDECNAIPNVCGSNGKCLNTVGSYTCQRCEVGFKYDDRTKKCEDVNECSDRRTNRCLNGRCVNTVGSFLCVCHRDFVLSRDGTSCYKRGTRPTALPGRIVDFCYKEIVRNVCIEPLPVNVTKADCCCRVLKGAGWSSRCESCPKENTEEYNTLCQEVSHRQCKAKGDVCPNGICGDKGSGLECICNTGFQRTPQGKCVAIVSPTCKRTGDLCPNGVCGDKGSGLECICSTGFQRSSQGKCVDINECEGRQICINSVCRNTIGSFVCDCKQGFVKGPNPLACQPISGPTSSPVCSREGEKCENGVCSRVNGKLQCSCNSGFTNVGNRCISLRCSREGDRCENGVCSRINGVLQCSCNPGFKYVGGKCVDRNECQENSNLCQNGKCVNLYGTFECVCASGYQQTNDKKSCRDVNECLDPKTCENGRCTNTVGGWRCSCNKGFALSKDERSCIDIDECTSVDDVCMNGICVNTRGDYFCRCNTGYSLSTDRHMCLDTMPSQCYASFTNNVCSKTLFRPLTISQCCCGKDNTAENPRAWGNPCKPCPAPSTDDFKKVCVHGLGKDSSGQDIDECSNNVGSQADLCPNGRCKNRNGDYYCVCNEGYRVTADGKKCEEVDECRENPSLCHRGRCQNVPGSYRCICPKGYVFDSRTKGCEDEDECKNPKQCIDGTCVNNIGSFKCVCPSELTLHESGRFCEDKRQGKCWRKVRNNVCEDNVNGDVTREVCCQTLGKAWGSPCEKCPSTGKCREGYVYKNFTCVDNNECESFSGICRNGRCVNTPGSYRCECSPGLTLDESKSVCRDEREAVCYQVVTRDKCSKPARGLYKKDVCCCSVGAAWGRPCEECPLRNTREFDELCRVDNGALKVIDECRVFPGICANGECIDTVDGFICKCRLGFDLDETGKNCTDIDECGLTPGLCGNGTCVNVPGAFRCNCREGFKNAPMMMEVCIDVNECEDLPNPCQGGTCVNTVGSFKCECPVGKRMDSSGLMCIDINECSEDSRICRNGICQNFMGSYQCACYRGFDPSDDMKDCIDINECLVNKGGCQYICQNTIGSFRCDCPPGLRLAANKRSCEDIDECQETPEICGVGNKCRNVVGGHICTCTEGYTLSEDRKSCIDVDECKSNPDLCLNGKCVNILGSFRCDCDEGFKLAERSMACIDVNECDSNIQTRCDRNSYCVNSVGSYSCTCKNGYEKFNDNCVDINECARGGPKCGRNGKCVNTDGSYRCVCKDGYSGDGRTCTDIDECNERTSSCVNGKCMNLPGSYKCECDLGYMDTEDGKGCEDIDECSAMDELCHHGKCLNIPGSFRCICDKGFQLNRYGDNCTDMNECMKTGMCLNGRCINEMGRYRCECDGDFKPNRNQTACIDTREGPCLLTKGTGPNSCNNLVANKVLRAYCCCSVGEAWNDPCEECPANGTEKYKHLCPSGVGFVVDPETTSLLDINECAFPNICVNGTCKNTLGSFECTCGRGFEYDPRMGSCQDINECNRTPYICGWTGVCMNLIGSYRCECPPGETRVGFVCVDYRAHECYKDKQDLDNIEGSTPGTSCTELLTPKRVTRTECCCSEGTAFGPRNMCKACPLRNTDEFKALCPEDGTKVSPEGIPTTGPIVGPARGTPTPYPPGGTGPVPTVRREDIDECSTIPDLCVMGKCTNTYQSYKCECHKGFALRGKNKCEDVNECLLDPCVNGECKNTFGSFMCTCSKGYTLDETGLTCVDHNECHLNGTCANGKCINLVGDYRCLCNRGFQLARNGKACEDMNECSGRTDLCRNGTCVNTVGSYKCRCNEGLRENFRHECKDIDECTEQRNMVCRNSRLCVNTVGSFYCDCLIGYKQDDTKRNCRDVNECTEIPGFCQDGTCTNTIGGSRCECTNGFRLHPAGDKCVDINECDEDQNLCKVDGNCINTVGSFRCSCPQGYTVANRGKMCVDMRKGYCFDMMDNRGCSMPRMKNVTKSQCCCTKGAGWGDVCEICPREQTETFTLLCPKGTGYAVITGTTVVDVNECELNPLLCKNGQCINNDGSYRCECYTGYVLDDTGRNCKDINECADSKVCGNGTCTNTLGSYTCDCAVGFQSGSGTPTCEDIDECSRDRRLCAFRCRNTRGSYQCVCPRGYDLHRDGRHCTDVDECTTGLHNCGDVCKNFIGGFKCICSEGFRRAGRTKCIDIDECRENPSRCRNGVCRNTAGSYMCDCRTGYKRSVDGKSCEDMSRGLCFSQVENGICKGSTKMMVMISKSECCCSAGVAWGSQCLRCPPSGSKEYRQLCISFRKDINECITIPGLCPNGKCINTKGSYRCMCHTGYQLTRDGKSCTDMDECVQIPRPCPNECENTPGSYKCKCAEGFQQGRNRGCVDIDECANKTHKCDNICVNTIGSYTCSCPKGYTQVGTSCNDINECQQQANICRFGRCVNQLGTYTCICNRGYKYNPQTKTCQDLNECNVRTCQGTCINLNGGYRCGCPVGFVRQIYWNRCIDVNECRTGANRCGSTTCVNIRGGYRCICPQGYRLDRSVMACRDLNECSWKNPCTTTGCFNTRGGFQCACPTGFYPIGGGHCISRYGQTCYNCAAPSRQKSRGSIVTKFKYKFGERPQTSRKATPAHYSSRRFPYSGNPFGSPRTSHSQYPRQQQQGYQQPQNNPYRYTYSYGTSSGSRRRRASHYVHKLHITVFRNATARDRLLQLTPVLEVLQKTFHYEISWGNTNLFEINVHKGVSILHSKKSLKNHVGLHKLYVRGRIEKLSVELPPEVEQQIEFTGAGVERKTKSEEKTTTNGKGNSVLGLKQARKFHLNISINVI